MTLRFGSEDQTISDISRYLGQLTTDVADLKSDVAELKEQMGEALDILRNGHRRRWFPIRR